jgi:hypothetical protein
MKKLLFLLLLISGYISTAQNYSCLQYGVKHFFINRNGYLRGIKIDSIKTSGATTTYFPFHTPRGAYSTSPYSSIILNPNGGSWLGKEVKQFNDGTFIFDNYWNDSVVIKTQANIGDTWVFYRDSSSLYYKATVVSIDTMTILSSLDSVKRIAINAFNTAGPDTADPLNNFVISLSKNNGFNEVMDLYTFPYHKPDSVYRLGLDFYLDRSTCNSSNVNNNAGLPVAPNPTTTLFKLIDFINPSEQQLYDWNTGDVIQSEHTEGILVYGGATYNFLSDTVVSKTITGHFVNYVINGTHCSCSYPNPCALIYREGAHSFSDNIYPILDTSQMPESSRYHGQYVFYYPDDTGYCSLTPAYTLVVPAYNTGGLGWLLEQSSYKLGIGTTEFRHADGEPIFETDNLLYYNINGTRCGMPLVVNDPKLNPSSFAVSPNPITSEVIITGTRKITEVLIFNLFGQEVLRSELDNEVAHIDVSGLEAGFYLVRINGYDVVKLVKE